MAISPLPRPKGETYVVKGQIGVAYEQNRITLFDGRFDTAFRVIGFYIAPKNIIDGGADVQAKLYTEELDYSQPAGQWNWQDNKEIGWATWYNGGTRASNPMNGLIDPENLVIEDLWVTATGNTDQGLCNYMIIMEKYKISQEEGTMTYIRNRGQDV